MFGSLNRRGRVCRGLAALAFAIAIPPTAALAQQTRTPDGVYTDAQAKRGQALFQERCAPCHGAAMGGGIGPPLTGAVFTAAWAGHSLDELGNKIKNTMPPSDSGKLTLAQSADVVAYILQAGKFPAGKSELPADEAVLKAVAFAKGRAQTPAAAASQAPSFPPAGNLTQVMRGILFPSSNIIFNVQTNDPAVVVKPPDAASGQNGDFSWVNWGAGIYKGWEIIDYAAIAVAESAPLMLTPGRRCENGRPVPVDKPDWIKFSLELAEAGRAAYRASQTRSQDAVSEASNQLADACLHCHEVYRDKPGGPMDVNDPSSKAKRCLPYNGPH